MGIIRKIIGPQSKYNASLPYTYMAKIPAFEKEEKVFNYYFADTICGLIEYLDENDIEPDEIQLYGVYKKEEVPLEKKYCLTPDGKWLRRPKLCKSLENRFKKTLEDRYKGHTEIETCSFDDRNRQGSGPF